MALETVGSNPTIHPNHSLQGALLADFVFQKNNGVSSSGKTQHFDCCIRWFESSHPSQPKTHFCLLTKVRFWLSDAFLTERDVYFVRDADFVCDARLAREWNASHHLSQRSGITYHFFENTSQQITNSCSSFRPLKTKKSVFECGGFDFNFQINSGDWL